MSTNKQNIMGTGAKTGNKKNISNRAVKGKITILVNKCPYCGHHKKIQGNPFGLNISKCSKCKREN